MTQSVQGYIQHTHTNTHLPCTVLHMCSQCHIHRGLLCHVIHTCSQCRAQHAMPIPALTRTKAPLPLRLPLFPQIQNRTVCLCSASPQHTHQMHLHCIWPAPTDIKCKYLRLVYACMHARVCMFIYTHTTWLADMHAWVYCVCIYTYVCIYIPLTHTHGLASTRTVGQTTTHKRRAHIHIL